MPSSSDDSPVGVEVRTLDLDQSPDNVLQQVSELANRIQLLAASA